MGNKISSIIQDIKNWWNRPPPITDEEWNRIHMSFLKNYVPEEEETYVRNYVEFTEQEQKRRLCGIR